MATMNQLITALNISPQQLCWLMILMIWTAVWKAVALWKSARKNHLVWFVLLIIINTAGILEILYIFLFSEMKCCKEETVKKRR